MGRHVLPLFSELVRARPSVDVVRKRLGGRVQSEPGVGLIVRLAPSSESSPVRFGVVLCVERDELYVVTERGLVHRVARDRAATVEPSDPALGAEILTLSADARVFATLNEGQTVRYLDDASASITGVLVERCRYGAIVRRADGVLMGVGFRKVWPGEEAGKAPS